ncbi:MAG TPA: hypothetical protein VLL25_03660 [Acidimicrobiales bacterium]|nr:hypothetical protein [Acidimicrobiales bacterium]
MSIHRRGEAGAFDLADALAVAQLGAPLVPNVERVNDMRAEGLDGG